jgi:hypothetical protein
VITAARGIICFHGCLTGNSCLPNAS